jgi:hypothetical protein
MTPLLLFIFSNKLSKGGSCEKMVIVLVCIAVAAAAGGFVFYGKYKQMEKFLTEYNLKDIDMQAIPDGTYNGKAAIFWLESTSMQ